MKLPEFAVNRRVSTAMIALILVVVGAISFSRLGLDLFPDLEYPTVSVITTYAGASPEDIENTITKPIEQVVSSVNGVKKVTSTTSEGTSSVQVEFEWGTNLDFAAQDLRDQIGLYKGLSAHGGERSPRGQVQHVPDPGHFLGRCRKPAHVRIEGSRRGRGRPALRAPRRRGRGHGVLHGHPGDSGRREQGCPGFVRPVVRSGPRGPHGRQP